MTLIPAPNLWPVIGNLHLLIRREFYSNLLEIFLKYVTPIRIKIFFYNIVLVDSPKDIQKIISAKKADLYRVTPYNNGLFSLKRKFIMINLVIILHLRL